MQTPKPGTGLVPPRPALEFPEGLSASAGWSRHYAEGLTPWDLGEASPPLLRALEAISPKTHPLAFVPGCGRGHDAIALAQRGHRVIAVDFAEAPVRELAALGIPGLTAIAADVFELPPAARGPFHLIVEHTCWCALDPARAEAYADVLASLLRPGGLLVGVFFAHGRPGGPPFSTSEAEVRRVFGSRLRLLALGTAEDSIPARAGQELLGLFVRPT